LRTSTNTKPEALCTALRTDVSLRGRVPLSRMAMASGWQRLRVAGGALAVALGAVVSVSPETWVAFARESEGEGGGGGARFIEGPTKGSVLSPPPPPPPREPEVVSRFSGSGFVFKDGVEVVAVDDPKVHGVVLHLSQQTRNLKDRLTKDPFTDSADASVVATIVGPISLREPIDETEAGEEVYAASKALFFKSLRVRRIYDKRNDCLLYVSYSTRLFQNNNEPNSRYRTGLAVVPLHRAGLPSSSLPPQPYHA